MSRATRPLVDPLTREGRGRHRRVWFALVAVSTLGVTGCQSETSVAEYLDPDHPAYAGLPQDVVAERVADPELREVLEQHFPVEDWVATVQANVAFTQYCRDALAVYVAWTSGDMNPESPVLMVPDVVSSPEDFHLAVDGMVGATTEAIASGDPRALRDQLTIDGGCNVVPVGPGSSTTIEEALTQN